MKITLPEGYKPPDNVKPGEDFEAVATLIMGDDGGYTLSAIDGVDIPDPEEEEEQQEEMPPEDENLASMVKMPWPE